MYCQFLKEQYLIRTFNESDLLFSKKNLFDTLMKMIK